MRNITGEAGPDVRQRNAKHDANKCCRQIIRTKLLAFYPNNSLGLLRSFSWPRFPDWRVFRCCSVSLNAKLSTITREFWFYGSLNLSQDPEELCSFLLDGGAVAWTNILILNNSISIVLELPQCLSSIITSQQNLILIAIQTPITQPRHPPC